MSCYRSNSVGSWNERLKRNKKKIKEHELSMIHLIDRFNYETNGHYAEFCDEFKASQVFSSSFERRTISEIVKNPSSFRRFLRLPLRAQLGFLKSILLSK